MKFWKKIAQDAVDSVKEVSTEAAADKLDILGDLALVGIFSLLTVKAFKSASDDRDDRHGGGLGLPDHTDVTINNYYYDRNGRTK